MFLFSVELWVLLDLFIQIPTEKHLYLFRNLYLLRKSLRQFNPMIKDVVGNPISESVATLTWVFSSFRSFISVQSVNQPLGHEVILLGAVDLSPKSNARS